MINKVIFVLFYLNFVSCKIGESNKFVSNDDKTKIFNTLSSYSTFYSGSLNQKTKYRDKFSTLDDSSISEWYFTTSESLPSTEDTTLTSSEWLSAKTESSLSTDDITTESSLSTDDTTTESSLSTDDTTTESSLSTDDTTTALGCDCGRHSVSCVFDDKGNKICLCEDGFAQIKDICVDCSCGKQSKNCFFDMQYQKVCICQKGYAQNSGVCSATCEYDVECLNGGLCKFTKEGTGFCECRRDFAGDKCELNNICKRINAVCFRYGAICTMKDGLPICECPPGKEMDEWGNCKSLCDSINCVHGSCEIMGYSYMCRCDDGFIGSRCDKKEIPYEPVKYIGLLITIMVLLILVVVVVVGFLCITIFIRKKKTQLLDSESHKLMH